MDFIMPMQAVPTHGYIGAGPLSPLFIESCYVDNETDFIKHDRSFCKAATAAAA